MNKRKIYTSYLNVSDDTLELVFGDNAAEFRKRLNKAAKTTKPVFPGEQIYNVDITDMEANDERFW